ncbi:type II toxin-antitoxin system RelE/ParE family toxin [Bifidobacterium sp. ESL0775]|uniref:type II toxin-antitoxin system RelE/ParE family toxin n=1 Tax=Bifidobacterium sp. ESL0775 TaxID=2983230 RepID=UPI0023F6B271|nr:type II toxin-antitoxin system RelE/ParE family toxin [Bifidobacterium sp. ESL0775]WEV69158.1 type II toxin-antitoxin system RelE/ParE family toxin [Bifidobacterium sp. ESL0775]
MQVVAAIHILEEDGPNLKRPLVGKISGSSIKALKELRPGSSGRSEIRILFVFDPGRRAVMLVAGDKSRGSAWNSWYKKAIPKAERIYREWLKNN